MSEAAAVPHPPSPWDLEFERLRGRFPGAKPSVLFCVHAFQQHPDISIADLEAQAEMHGLKVSVGSWTAARRLLAPPAAIAERPAPSTAPAGTPDDSATATPSSQDMPVDAEEPAQVAEFAVQGNPPTEAPAKAITVDDAEGPIERMVRLVVAEVQAAGDPKAERLRTAIRQALAVIETAPKADSDRWRRAARNQRQGKAATGRPPRRSRVDPARQFVPPCGSSDL
jgi:hypothetical protein